MSVTDTTEIQQPSTGSPAEVDRRVLGIPFTFFSFLVVGASAFVVNLFALFLVYDAGILWFLPGKDAEWNIAGLKPEARLFIASIIAVEIAIAWKFALYEHWTFSDRPRRGNILWRFLQLNVASALATLVTLATVNVLTPLLGIIPYITTAIGVIFAFMLNWLFSNHFIWREHESPTA
jgi:putative flippase GtrA